MFELWRRALAYRGFEIREHSISFESSSRVRVSPSLLSRFRTLQLPRSEYADATRSASPRPSTNYFMWHPLLILSTTSKYSYSVVQISNLQYLWRFKVIQSKSWQCSVTPRIRFPINSSNICHNSFTRYDFKISVTLTLNFKVIQCEMWWWSSNYHLYIFF